jgi:hypothetical protein
MKRGLDNRMGRLRRVIDESPVRRHLLREAYEWFKLDGELPDDDHVAFEVVMQAMRGGEEEPLVTPPAATDQLRKTSYVSRDRREALGAHACPLSVRLCLFAEALFEPVPWRNLARAAIALEVARGGDVEATGFAAHHGIPVYGSPAMHVLGYPRCLALPPFEHQARRLFTRLDNLRSRVNQDNPVWFEAQAQAIVKFNQTGELPRDDLQFEIVLADAELDQLRAHKKGKDVTKAMALFDQIARGEKQEQALRKLCAMAAAGKL